VKIEMTNNYFEVRSEKIGKMAESSGFGSKPGLPLLSSPIHSRPKGI
jgi:hypothetical protein